MAEAFGSIKVPLQFVSELGVQKLLQRGTVQDVFVRAGKPYDALHC